MNLGRYYLGQFVPIPLSCVVAGVAVAPTAAPTLSIYDSANTETLADRTMFPIDKENVTGQFLYLARLSSSFSAGQYSVRLRFASSGTGYPVVHTFQVVSGGHSSGAYVGMHHFQRPDLAHILGVTDGGTLEFRKNPKVRT